MPFARLGKQLQPRLFCAKQQSDRIDIAMRCGADGTLWGIGAKRRVMEEAHH